ncbi:MAG TPA: clostripain-related cysteine peptidase [Desulfobacterales bacterium]
MILRNPGNLIASVGCLALWAALGCLQIAEGSEGCDRRAEGSVTVMFYLNGDNDLTDEVLSAVDRLETVGASPAVHVVALVDGHPAGTGRYGRNWSGTHLLYITADDQPGRINSPMLADWGEQDLGRPDTVTRFVRTAVDRFPARRYVFCAFAHGKGVIDTGNLGGSSATKTLSISPDDSSGSIMSLASFAAALEKGLDGRRFSLTVLFSCLSGMVEIAYELSNVTDYLIASEDEIRLVNDPPGTHQLRGIFVEDLPRYLKSDPLLPDTELAVRVIDHFIQPYLQAVPVVNPAGYETFVRHAAGLALIDCRAAGRLAAALDGLAARLIDSLNRPDRVVPTLAEIGDALGLTQRFQSFLNLEYYDLLQWLETMAFASNDEAIRRSCRRSAEILVSQVVCYERHTENIGANGLSIYFSHHSVPENVHTAHREMYDRTRFSRDTRWNDLIGVYRRQLQRHRLELLAYQCRQAHRRGDLQAARRSAKQLLRHLSRGAQPQRPGDDRRIANLLDALPADIVEELQKKPAQDTSPAPVTNQKSGSSWAESPHR